VRRSSAALLPRLGALAGALAALGAVASLSPAASSAAAATKRTCVAGAISTTTSPAGTEGEPTEAPAQPSPEGPCWAEVNPYPFGSEGVPVTGSTLPCSEFFSEAVPSGQCKLTVTSMAFRAWNRGLAATVPITGENEESSKNPYGVWTFNGTSWVPSPGFPGSSHCPGHTVLWAGKKDYWLIGDAAEVSWSGLCRFDGATLEWEELPLPPATLARVTEVRPSGEVALKPGEITSGACTAWNNCWFFGTYGTVVHWNGEVLADASPEPAQSWLDGEYTAAVGQPDLAGSPFGVAVSATGESFASETPLPGPEPGQAPPEIDVSAGGPFSPLSYTPPTSPQEGDPYRTDLVAVAFDSEGQGWVAGNPASLRLAPNRIHWLKEYRPAVHSLPAAPSPLAPVSTAGASTSCEGPPARRFTYSSPRNLGAIEPAGAYLWSSIGVIPGTGEALAGGRLQPKHGGTGTDPNEAASGEPVIARAACDGATTVTRFRTEDPTRSGTSATAVAADQEAPAQTGATAEVTAIAVNATNDAWAATSPGELVINPLEVLNRVEEPPHLYRLTNGLAPEAPAGNDEEERPLPPEEQPIEIIEPPLPEQVPTLDTVLKTRRVHRKAAVYAVKAALHRDGQNLSLYLTFRLRRATTLGAEGLRHGRVVSKARPRRFKGRTGLLVLSLNRQHWPTKVRFIG
jgi:hypothetical protein